MHNFTKYVNPHLGDLLEQVRMDKVFTRGEGHYLYDDVGNMYLDFIAAYGALPFGYNPPGIWEALEEVRALAQPSFVQPSALEAAGLLAKRLTELAPGDLQHVTFTNSGAEAVEAAIKMARSATGKMGILSADNSFHGKTLGALSATGREYYQSPFGAPVGGFKTIPYGNLEALGKELEYFGSEYAALILEPIQGEGGIVVPPPGYLKEARELCRQYGIMFILDEIQTGLGRTGSLFACQDEGVFPDMLLLAKALGGGLYPIGACLSTAQAYTKDFGERHSSTFAGNTLGCRVGLKVLDILSAEDQAIVKQVKSNGERLVRALKELALRYPRVLKGVRGRGYMLGLELEMTRSDFSDCFLSVLSEQGNLTPLISSYLLNAEKLRVAPTLNGNKVIRLEPSLTVTWDECEKALNSLERVLAVLASGNTLEILRPILDLDEKITSAPRVVKHSWDRYQPSEDPREGRFAFLIHPLDLYNYYQFDPSLKALPADKLQQMADLGSAILDPFIIGRTTVVSRAGYRAYGEFITLPHTAREMLEMKPEEILSHLEKAMELALERGARLVGLGAYTSVVSRSGTLLQGKFLPLTTGNSYTVVAGAEAIKLAARRFSMDLGQCSAAVIGATGSIGRTLAILMSEEIHRIILVGNSRHPQASSRRLRRVGADICSHLARQVSAGWIPPSPDSLGARLMQMELPAQGGPPEDWLPVVEILEKEGLLVITTELSQALPQAQVVITATSSVDDLINPMWVAKGAIICDISKPSNVRPSLRQVRPDVLVIDGGVVAVPGRPSLGWDFGFEQGLAYACMAETMMLALEHHYTDMSLGPNLSLENMIYLRNLAQKHGFELSQLRSFDLPLSEEDWRQVANVRSRACGSLKLESIS